MNRALRTVALQLPDDGVDVDRLIDAVATDGVRVGRGRRRRAHDVYWDTADLRLRDARAALKVHRTGERSRASVVSQAAGGERVHRAAARAGHVNFDTPTLARWMRDEGLRSLDGALAPIFRIAIASSERVLRFDDATLTFRVDDARAAATVGKHTRVGAWRTLRIALIDGNAHRPWQLAERVLRARKDARLSFATDAERGYALATGVLYPPARAEDVDVRAPFDAIALAVRAAAASVAHLRRNVDGARGDGDPEYVHQMRVALRRLRAAAMLARAVGVRLLSDDMKQQIRWLARALGDTRDRDVFGRETWPAMKARIGSTPPSAVARIEAAIALQRAACSRRLQAALRSRRFDALVIALALATAVGEPTRDTSRRDHARRDIRRMLRKCERRVAAHGAHVARLDTRQRHALRVDMKKLRYPAEFAAVLYDGRDAKAYVRRVAAVQSALGDLNDVAVGGRIVGAAARKLAPRVRAAVRELWRRFADEREQALRERLDATWKRFRASEPFWS